MKRLIGFAFLIVLCCQFLSCSKDTDEERIKNVIRSVQKAVERKEIISVLEHLSKSYTDPQGHDYDGIKGLLAFYFFRHRSISVYIPEISVFVTDGSAKAVFQTILGGGGDEKYAMPVLPEALGAYSFNVSFRKEDGKWKVISAEWMRVGEEKREDG